MSAGALLRRTAASAIAGLLLTLATASLAAAADDYTLPFYDPSVQLSYGLDRDPRLSVQLDYTGQVWWDDDPHWGRVYDNHTGLDYPMALLSKVVAAKDGVVEDFEGGFGTQQFGNFGNFVQLRHADGRRTLYYHLASQADGGMWIPVDTAVKAGQWIGRSGCSGLCKGAHLHFEVLVQQFNDLIPSDPMFHRLWTTWPGRVPWLAAYVRENNAGVEVIQRWRTITHWVEFKNIGGRPWRQAGVPGRVVLGTWNPAKHSSPFAAADWPASWLATPLDQTTVWPDGVGRFTFGLRGSPPPGSYRETFNLVSDGLAWFDHARLGSFYVPITVTNLQP